MVWRLVDGPIPRPFLRLAEVPGLHHGEVGESAAHTVMREAVCASEDVCEWHEEIKNRAFLQRAHTS